MDIALILSTIIVAGLGVVLVYSATRSKLAAADINPHYFLTRQAAYVVVGGVFMIVLATLDYRWLEHASAVLYVAMILALLAMFTGIGSSALGATRWIQLGPRPDPALGVRHARAHRDGRHLLRQTTRRPRLATTSSRSWPWRRCRSCSWSSNPTSAAAS